MFGCRTPRARGGPPRTSAPTTHPAPTRPGARRTRAALGAGRPNGSGARSTRAAPGVGLSWRTRWRMKPRASQPQNHSPCPRASPRSVLTGRGPGPRSGRCRTPRARGGPPRTSAPTTHPAPTRPGARSTRAALGAGPSGGGGGTARRDRFVADEVADEAARKPASKPFSVSPCLPALRVNRPEARSPVRSRRSAPLPVHCRTSRAEGGPPRTSAPTTHPAPTRPGARRTRAAFGAGRPNRPGMWRPQAGGSQFIAAGAGGHPAGQHGARGDTKARRRLRVGLHAHQSRVA